jgi:cytochrome c oxidase assembly protein subunit 15
MGLTTPVRVPDWQRRASGWLTTLSLINLVANVGIILTGGAVRLTGSGLGCPTWPRCTDDSYVPHPELGIHGAIEFGNRMLTFVLVAVVVSCWLAALGHRAVTGAGRPWRLATLVALGVPAQAVIGGISVLTDLNPWVVALHLLVSLAMVAVCVALLAEANPAWFPRSGEHSPHRLVVATYAVVWLVLYLGTVVTGSGPHAGDASARRNGLDSATASHVHAAAVYTLLAVTLVLVVLARHRGDRVLMRSAGWLLVVEVAQGAVGIIQVRNGLPEVLVGLHLLGAALTIAAATRLLITTTSQPAFRDGGA